MIPDELKAIIRQKTDAATRGKKIMDVFVAKTHKLSESLRKFY